MKFHNVILNLTLIVLLCAVSKENLISVVKFTRSKDFVYTRMCATKFISQSFRNCCDGYGFGNLDEWQKTCRAMFDLEYIGWCKAENFMDLKMNVGEVLLCGTWKGLDSSGEVFCKVKLD